MKCKQQRKETEKIRLLRKELFSQLKKLNPKKYFMISGNEVHVNTYELWKLVLPEDWEVTIGKNQQEINYLGYMTIQKEECLVFIYGW